METSGVEATPQSKPDASAGPVGAQSLRLQRLWRGISKMPTWDMALVLAVAFGVRLIWATIVPPWLAPDEFAHFSYISHVIENGRIPNDHNPDTRYPAINPEADALCAATFCSDLSTLGSAPGHPTRREALPFEHDFAPARQYALPLARRKTSGAGPGTNYPPLYYLYGAAFYGMVHSAPVVDRLLAVRAGSAFLSALSAVFAYLFALELRKDRAWGRCLGLCVALMPMHAFIGASVNNDGAFFATTAALCWLAVKVWLVPNLTIGLATSVGLVCGLALLSKPTSVPVVFLTVLVFAIRLLRDVYRSRSFLGDALRLGGVFSAGVVLCEGTWLLFRKLSSVPKPPTAPGMIGVVLDGATYSLGQYFIHLQGLGSEYYHWLFFRSFWGQFGWLEVDMPPEVHNAISWVLVAALIGLFARLLMNREERLMGVILLFVMPFNVAALFLAADYVNCYALTGAPYGMQGRYFFGTLIPFLYIIAAGLGVWRRSVPVMLRLIPIGMLLVQASALGQVLRKYYGIVML